MIQKFRHAKTTPSAQATDVAATATPARGVDTPATVLPASDTQDTEMQNTGSEQPDFANEGGPGHPATTEAMSRDQELEPLSMQPPRHMHTDSSSAGQSRQTAEILYQSHVHQPHSGRTNWGKLKEQAQKDRSKRREVLIAVNPTPLSAVLVILTRKIPQTTTTERYDSDSPDEDEGDDDANDNREGDHDDIAHISKKELRDMILAAAKTALEMSKRSTRKVQRGNEAKRTKRTALQKEKEADEGWERQIFCVSSLGFEITSAHDQATELRS
jgi:hypothetical protein